MQVPAVTQSDDLISICKTCTQLPQHYDDSMLQIAYMPTAGLLLRQSENLLKTKAKTKAKKLN